MSTSRDLHIFMALRHGALRKDDIYREINFPVTNAKTKVDGIGDTCDETKKQKPIITMAMLKKRLFKLKNDGYIRSKTFADNGGRGTFALYVVSKWGLAELASAGINTEKVNCRIPAKTRVGHAAMMTNAKKVIQREAAALGYKVDVRDGTELRDAHGRKNGHLIPNIEVIFNFLVKNDYENRTLHINIDLDTQAPTRIYQKCRKIKCDTLILCPSVKRMQHLKNHFAKHKNEDLYAKVSSSAFFALMSDFADHGFMSAEICTCEGVDIKIIPDNLNPKSKFSF